MNIKKIKFPKEQKKKKMMNNLSIKSIHNNFQTKNNNKIIKKIIKINNMILLNKHFHHNLKLKNFKSRNKNKSHNNNPTKYKKTRLN